MRSTSLFTYLAITLTSATLAVSAPLRVRSIDGFDLYPRSLQVRDIDERDVVYLVRRSTNDDPNSSKWFDNLPQTPPSPKVDTPSTLENMLKKNTKGGFEPIALAYPFSPLSPLNPPPPSPIAETPHPYSHGGHVQVPSGPSQVPSGPSQVPKGPSHYFPPPPSAGHPTGPTDQPAASTSNNPASGEGSTPPKKSKISKVLNALKRGGRRKPDPSRKHPGPGSTHR